MATLRDITRRIKSVRKTAQITKAMQMVAAARLRRVQEALENTRPYAEKMSEVIGSLVRQAGDDVHPLMEERAGPRKLGLLVVSSDRGLCGGLNTNVCRQVRAFSLEHEKDYESIALHLIGRKARDYYKRRPVNIKSGRNQLFSSVPEFELVKPVASELTRSFLDGEVDEVQVLFTQFVSMMSQRPALVTLLPLRPGTGSDSAAAEGSQQDAGMCIYEPSRAGLLATLLPRFIDVRLYWILLESLTSEFAARMTAMDSATSNARDMIERLTLTFNRARQAAITKELMDIVNGAEALK